MIDLDHFKSVNDRFGHPVGDRVLATLAALLRRRLRQSDTIGRYGGEEFVVLFEGLPEHEVLRLMERVLARVPRDRPGGAGQAAASAPPSARAWPCSRRGMTLDAWKKAADDALYAAKAAGRNRVMAAAATPPPTRARWPVEGRRRTRTDRRRSLTETRTPGALRPRAFVTVLRVLRRC